MSSARPLIHDPDCRWANVEERHFVDRPGWVYGRCRTCRASGWRQEQLPPAPPPASRFVCREHPGQPVTWKGTGCARCAEDRRPTEPRPRPPRPAPRERTE